ncbi:MAG: copper resistance protein CopC [Nitrososphaeraceae archaeon]|nr:copper resistance protein CopC [Nitrososphaeraceae archaeon]
MSSLILFPNGIPKSYAHAFTIKSDPSPSQSLPKSPSKVDVYFSEPVDIRYSKLMVIDASGKQVDNKDQHYINGDQTTLSVTLPGDLKDGVYTVSSKVLSAADGHVVDNAFVFGIGEATIPTQASSTSSAQSQLYIPNAIARFPALVGQVMVVGAAFSTLWLWKPISKIAWLKDSLAEMRNNIDRNFIILVLIGSIILVVSNFGIIYVQANSINTGIVEAMGTKFGTVWIARAMESFILLAISLAMFRKVMKRMPKNFAASPTKGEVLGIFAIGLTILATTSLIGHGAANGQVLPITIDFIHNLAASLWIGGIIYIGFIVVPKLRHADGLEEYVKASALSILIPRFSTVPVIILGVIVITGPFLLYMLESNLDLTLASLYGKWLIIKLSLAAVMIALGGYNQIIVYRQALRTSIISTTVRGTAGGGGGEIVEAKTNNNNNGNSSYPNNKTKKSALSKFGRSTKAESIVGIALLAAVALLVNTGLPASEFQQQNAPTSTSTVGNTITTQQDQGFTATRFVEDGNRVILSINPYTPGNNNFKISFLDSNRNPVDVKSVQLRYTQIEKGIGPINVDAQKVSKGVFSANAAFGIPGKWNLEIEGVQTKANALNIVATYDLSVNPKLSQLAFSVQDFKIPQNNSQPLYPVYDKSRNSIWVGDTVIDSGRILEYNLNTHRYVEHKVNGTSIVTVMALDPHDQSLWYVDPLMKNLGQYNIETGTNKLYKIPIQGVISGIAIDSSNNLWLTSPTANGILKFNTQTKSFAAMTLPTANAQPLGIITDQSGQIWVAEGIGKLANIDPTKNNKVSEYAPTGQNNTLKSPTALLADPTTGNIYISDHDGHVVSVFNPLLKTFKEYPPLDPNGLPFGMAIDGYGNLWVAEHTINKVAVINPTTGETKEVSIPAQSPFVQWLTSDSKGNIWLAEQRGNSLAVISSTAKLAPPSSSVSQNNNGNNKNNSYSGIPKLGFSYADIVGPSLAGGIIISALFYSKSIMDLKKSVRHVIRRQNNNYRK